MTITRRAGLAIIFLLIFGASNTSVRAFCNSSLENYPMFQCAELGYFDSVPAPFTESDIIPVFWQIGFGNDTINTSNLAIDDGTGITGKSTFNGNDSGTFPVDLLDAFAFSPAYFPPGSVCLGSNDWANGGVDGCPDNPRAQFFIDRIWEVSSFTGTIMFSTLTTLPT